MAWLRYRVKHEGADFGLWLASLAEPEPDPNLLPEDGIIDEVAVEAAIYGIPRVSGQPLRLTQKERELAGALILARGGTEETLRARLYLPSARSARELFELIASPSTDAGELAA
jgi:hypothetical protein